MENQWDDSTYPQFSYIACHKTHELTHKIKTQDRGDRSVTIFIWTILTPYIILIPKRL